MFDRLEDHAERQPFYLCNNVEARQVGNTPHFSENEDLHRHRDESVEWIVLRMPQQTFLAGHIRKYDEDLSGLGDDHGSSRATPFV